MKSARSIFQELLDTVWFRLFRSGRNYPNGKPGELVERLSKEDRDKLTSLKSDDVAISSVNPAYFCDSFYFEKNAKKEFSDTKLDFDKKILNK